MSNFFARYTGEEANYQSGASGADILRAALRVFKDDVGKDFKLVDVWSQVHHLDRWAGGVKSASGSKRTKRGHYSSSDGGEDNTSREGTPTDDARGLLPVHGVGRTGLRRRRRRERGGEGEGEARARTP